MSRWGNIELGVIARLLATTGAGSPPLVRTIRATASDTADAASKAFPATFVSWDDFTVTDRVGTHGGTYARPFGSIGLSIRHYVSSGLEFDLQREQLYAVADATRDALIAHTPVGQEPGNQYQLWLLRESLEAQDGGGLKLHTAWSLDQTIEATAS